MNNKKKKETVWHVGGYYYDGKTAYTLMYTETGKTKKIRGVK